jgi:hypothetical protein
VWPKTLVCRGCGCDFILKSIQYGRKYCSPRCYLTKIHASYPQERITRFLEDLGFVIESEKRWEWLRNPVTGAQLRIDIYLPEQNVAIEYDGELHRRDWGSSGRLEKVKQRDAAKNALLRQHGIPLLRITKFQSNCEVVAAAIKELLTVAGYTVPTSRYLDLEN